MDQGGVASGPFPNELAVHPNGVFWYGAMLGPDRVEFKTINQGTGLPGASINSAAGNNPSGLTMDPTGRFLYAMNVNDGTINQYTIDQTTGALTSLGTVASGPGAHRMAILAVPE